MEMTSALRAAMDAIVRAMDGIESDLYEYAAEQVGKATYYLSEANFDIDRHRLIEENPSGKTPA